MRGELPAGWAWSSLEETCTAVGGGTPSKADPEFWDYGTIPWVSPKDMKARVITGSEDRVTERALQRLTLIPTGSVLLVVRSGILSRTLPVAVTALPVTVNQDMRAFVPHAGIAPDFLAWQLIGKERDVLATTSKDGTTVASIEAPALASFPLAVAPAAEQTRILAKLEELLSDLDAGVAELKAAQAKLQHYRQSLLKAAVEGSLTRAWREAHPAPEETGADLLARILVERRARWEAQQLAKFEAQGKAPTNGWQEKYPEPVVPQMSDLPSLPRSWTWATLSQIGWLDRGRSKHRPRNAPHLYGGPYPFVQTGDIRHADTYLRKVEASYSEAGLAQSRLWPESTLCITIAANIGKTAILGMAACFPDSVVGFLPASDAVSVRYVDYFMRSAQAQLEDEAPATAQKNINLETLERLCIPLPPEAEIREVVEALNRAFDGVKALDTAVDMGLKQSTAQRQNLLRAAFAGQLVPQDPADEPASELLARIRAGRAERAPARRRPARKETA